MAEYISSGIVSGLLVNIDCYVMSGGIVKQPVVSGNGVLNISNGGLAESAIVSSGNTYRGLYVFSGGIAVNTNIQNGGTTYLYEGGKASGGTVSSGGALNVNANACAWDIVVQPGASVTVLSGASVFGLKDNGGTVYILDGAYVTFAPNVIDSLNVNSTDYNVRSGTTLTNATVGADGRIIVNSGGVVDTTIVNSCNMAKYMGLYVFSGGSAVNTDIRNNGALYVYSGGSALACTVSSGGELNVNANACAWDIVVQPGASVTVLSGASVFGLKDNGGTVYIQDGAYVTFAPNVIDSLNVNSTDYNVRSGTTLTNATVGANGRIIVDSGGVVDTTIVNSCNMAKYMGLYVFSGGSAVNTDIRNNGALYVYSGGSALGCTVSAGGDFYVNENGYARDIIVQPGASVTVLSGASVFGLKDNGGTVYIQDGAYVTFAPNVIDSLNVNSTDYNVRSGTTLTNATVGANGQIIVNSGGVVDTTIVNSCNMAKYKGLYVFSGGSAVNTDIRNNGALYVYSGGSALGCTVSAGAVCYVEANGFASDFRVQSGANLIVRSGGTACNVLEDGGIVTVLDGAVVTFAERLLSDTVLTDGTMTIHSGTTMVNTVIGQNGKLNVFDGARTEKTTVNACVPDGGLVLYNNAVAVGNTMNDSGFTYIFSGGTAIDNTINSGGSMTIFSGAVMKNVDVMSGGKLYMSSGSLLTGRIRVDTLAGYIFIDDYGCTIDFDISEIDPSGDVEARLDDFERIRPEPKDAPQTPDFTITVDPDQAIGTYKIAISRGRVDFPTITVKNTLGQTLGTLSENDRFTYNGAEYRLRHEVVINTALQQGVITLFLHIGDNSNGLGPSQPIVSADIKDLTSSNVTVTAEFDSYTVNKLYSYDAVNWMTYTGGVSVSENSRVYFRGENSRGASGIACYTVKNIDKAAPTTPTGLSVSVDKRNVSLSWQPSSDDLSGMKDYLVTYSHDGIRYTVRTTETSFTIKDADYAEWQWSVQACDVVGNLSAASVGDNFEVVDPNPPPAPSYIAKGDRDGNGVSDVMFVWTGNTFAHGYWMNGHSNWWSANATYVSSEWDNLGSYDMNGDGKADTVMFGNVIVNESRGAYIGFYSAGNDMNGWQSIGYLSNSEDVAWQTKVGNLTGNYEGRNSIVWFAPERYILGFWKDGTDQWVGLSTEFGGDAWKFVGCGDFTGTGKDSVLMSYNGGQTFYSVGADGVQHYHGGTNWSGWDIRAIGDFAGDGKDDIVLFHEATGSIVMLADGIAENWTSIGQLDPTDWFVIGAGDYNGDQQDDLLVRQYSTGMLGYYDAGDVATGWVEMGKGVDMQWTVIV